MPATFKQLTDFFQEIGATHVAHTSKSYLAHAIAVYHDLKQWGCDEELARVGLFHSIYGTERFQGFTLSLERREEVRDLIGERAERISWLNCVMDRGEFDREAEKNCGPYSIRNRITGAAAPVSDQDFADLCLVHLCDWLEQLPRCRDFDYRRDAYRRLAERAGGPGREAYDRVFNLV